MRRKLPRGKGGFTLIEVVVAMVVLALVAAPLGGALVVSVRVNAYADRVLKARLEVSSAVERLMAEGVEATEGSFSWENEVTVEITAHDGGVYSVTVKSTDVPEVSVSTEIHEKGAGG